MDCFESRIHNNRLKYVGMEFPTKNHGDLVVTSYEHGEKVGYRFLKSGYAGYATINQIRRGSVKDRLARTVCGVGYIGSGKYNTEFEFLGDKPYYVWRNMIHRCYSGEMKSYVGCSVCDEWHNFQVFAEWFTENHKNGYEIDKDIRKIGNKVYSPDTCKMVPTKENMADMITRRWARMVSNDIADVFNVDKNALEAELIKSNAFTSIAVKSINFKE